MIEGQLLSNRCWPRHIRPWSEIGLTQSRVTKSVCCPMRRRTRWDILSSIIGTVMNELGVVESESGKGHFCPQRTNCTHYVGGPERISLRRVARRNLGPGQPVDR
jgi:hypothetical protein